MVLSEGIGGRLGLPSAPILNLNLHRFRMDTLTENTISLVVVALLGSAAGVGRRDGAKPGNFDGMASFLRRLTLRGPVGLRGSVSSLSLTKSSSLKCSEQIAEYFPGF